MLMAGLIFISSVSAQIRKIPAAATSAFTTKFPDAKNVSWTDKITAFEADFDMDTHHYQSSFNSKGEWKKTEKTITEDEVPIMVKDGLAKSKYTEWKITSWKEVTYKDGKLEYRLFAKKTDIQKKYLYFNDKGQLLRDTITL